MISVRRADPLDPPIRALIAAHLAHSAEHSPATSCYALSAEDMRGLDVFAVVEREAVLGCGALKDLGDGTAEVKSVHVVAAARGRGVSKVLMAHLIAVAQDGGYTALVLETGSDLLPGYVAARGLYDALGFRVCGPITGYEADPNSVYFRLDLARG